MDHSYDLIICGGGLAGLCLARQLSLSDLNLRILVLDQLRRPLPAGAFKVGESTIEVGAFYYRETLGLADYLEREQLEKLGLRYFYSGPDGNASIATRPEYGVARFLPAKSHQLDRGELENHLRGLVEGAGIQLKEGVQVKEIRLDVTGHTVVYRENDVLSEVSCRWVVDAMGRRRYLQNKLNLAAPSPGMFNSAWFRLKGKLRVQDLVPPTETAFHSRVVDDRWNSTNHLMGKGYWVWLIPLAPDMTSVGIVTDESIHQFAEYSTFEKAMEWLRKNEPSVAEAIPNFPLLDFKKLKNYSYTSTRVFSSARWACVGEAATFADPYYSVGSNLIAYANGFVQRFIEMDRAGSLTDDYIAYANRYVITLNDALSDTIHRGYPLLHNGPVMAMKTIWDYYIGWATSDPQLYHEAWLDPRRAAAISGLLSSLVVTQSRMMRMFEDWATHTSRYRFEFIDYIEDLPTLTRLHKKCLPPRNMDFAWLSSFIREAVEKIEEVAQVMFELAVADILSEHLPLLRSHPWINTEAIGLNPARWETDGLFSPRTRSRDLTALRLELGALFGSSALSVRTAGAE